MSLILCLIPPKYNKVLIFNFFLQTEKKTKFIQPYSKIAIIENLFDHGEDRIVYAFTTLPALVEEATKAGATFVGGPQDIKTILVSTKTNKTTKQCY